jgi:hypothetical protein
LHLSFITCHQPKLRELFHAKFVKFSAKNSAMDKRWDITVEEKTKILCWKEEGVSTAEIATRLGCHPAAVQRQYVVLKKLPPMTRRCPSRRGWLALGRSL